MLRIHIEYAKTKRNKNGFTFKEEVALKYRLAQQIMAEAEVDPEFAEDVSDTDTFMDELHMRYIDLEEMHAEAERLKGNWWQQFKYKISPI